MSFGLRHTYPPAHAGLPHGGAQGGATAVEGCHEGALLGEHPGDDEGLRGSAGGGAAGGRCEANGTHAG